MAAEPIALIFKLNNGLVERTLDGLADEEVWRRPGPGSGGNPIAWLIGHVANTRASLVRELGHPVDQGSLAPELVRVLMDPSFRRGSALADRSAYPSRAAIEAAWKATHARMRDAFAGVTEQWLAQPSAGYPLPGAKTMGDRLGFFAFHESYHVGQMAYVRRLLGHSGVAG
jgi:hypothetical protein